MRTLAYALAAGMAALATAQAGAQSLQSTRYYVGAGANFADHDYKLPGTFLLDGDDYEAGAKVYGGAELSPLWGVEIGYADFTTAYFDYLQGGAAGHGDAEGYGAYLAGKGRWPLHPRLEVFGKLGLAYSHRKVKSNLPLTVDSSNNDTGVYAGVGMQWNIAPQWALVGEYERYGKSKKVGASADVLSVSMRFSF
jgi:OOP family OmpA-OmpF porin